MFLIETKSVSSLSSVSSVSAEEEFKGFDFPEQANFDLSIKILTLLWGLGEQKEITKFENLRTLNNFLLIKGSV